MLPTCHPSNGATFTTSKDQIYISFSLDRKLLQSFTAGNDGSPQLELLLMNKVCFVSDVNAKSLPVLLYILPLTGFN